MSKRVLLAALVVVTTGACASESQPSLDLEVAAIAVVTKNPLSEVQPPAQGDEKLRGRIVAIERAGSYTYLLLASPQGLARWVVTMRKGLSLGSEVNVTNMGTQRAFRSKRLGRTFDELIFGVVRPAVPTTTKEG